MKSFIAAVVAVTSLSAMAQTYKIDPSGTKIEYSAGKVVGSPHVGQVTAKTGNLVFKGEEITGGEVVVDMNSITATDITDKDMNTKYLGHIKSADFFDTAKYPDAKIVIKNSKKTDKGLEVNGDLTFHGKTNPVTFLVTDLKKTDSTVTGKSNINIDRTKWDLKYGSSSFIKGLGDKAIKDEFSLAIDLTAKK